MEGRVRRWEGKGGRRREKSEVVGARGREEEGEGKEEMGEAGGGEGEMGRGEEG